MCNFILSFMIKTHFLILWFWSSRCVPRCGLPRSWAPRCVFPVVVSSYSVAFTVRRSSFVLRFSSPFCLYPRCWCEKWETIQTIRFLSSVCDLCMYVCMYVCMYSFSWLF
jgi:hypothetical protein